MGNTFFSQTNRSCYRKMLSKKVGEHHAKHHDMNKIEVETSTLFEVKLALLIITEGETIHSQIHNKTELSENCRN